MEIINEKFCKDYNKKKNCGIATTLNAKCYNGVSTRNTRFVVTLTHYKICDYI